MLFSVVFTVDGWRGELPKIRKMSLRVTPIPKRGNAVKDADHAERVFERLKRAFVARYEGGCDSACKTWGPEYPKAVQREMRELRAAFNG